jgi:hypothetical protein
MERRHPRLSFPKQTQFLKTLGKGVLRGALESKDFANKFQIFFS